MLMGIIFIILAVISLVVLIVGFVWLLVGSGETTRRSGEAVGAQMMGDQMDDEWEPTISSASLFKGKASEVEVSASVSFADIKGAVASGNWRQVLPALLAMGGLIGLLVFGALAAFVIIDDKLIGGVILAFVLFAVVRAVLGFLRA